MTYIDSYAVVLVLHLLTVAFVVGPAAVAGVTSVRLVRAGSAEQLHAAARTCRVYTLATLATVLLGTAMVGLGDVGQQWEFSQVWVSASYALSLVAVALTLVLVVPGQQAAAEALEAGQDAARQVGRIAAGSGLALLAWTAIIVLMVTKPGA